MKSDVFRVPREVWTDFQTLGEDITESRWYQIIVSSIVGGSYICFGATLSLFLSAGVSALGPAEFLLGIGFIAGFSMVILSGSLLFTEVNIILPAFFIKSWLRACLSCFFFWGLTWIGNLIGILATATFINLAGVVTPEVADRLREVLQSKLTSFVIGGGRGWFQVVLSGVLGNFLVGTAAILASRGRTNTSIVVGLFFPVLTFVALGVQHSPANMSFFSLGLIYAGIYGQDVGVGWGTAFGWNIIPASIGNVIGGVGLSALFFSFALSECRDRAILRKKGKDPDPIPLGDAFEESKHSI